MCCMRAVSPTHGHAGFGFPSTAPVPALTRTPTAARSGICCQEGTATPLLRAPPHIMACVLLRLMRSFVPLLTSFSLHISPSVRATAPCIITTVCFHA